MTQDVARLDTMKRDFKKKKTTKMKVPADDYKAKTLSMLGMINDSLKMCLMVEEFNNPDVKFYQDAGIEDLIDDLDDFLCSDHKHDTDDEFMDDVEEFLLKLKGFKREIGGGCYFDA